MKKMLLLLPVASLLVMGFICCSGTREWKHEERKALRKALQEYREMVYLNDLTDAEYALFTDEVAGDIENAYPVYTTFIEMPGVEDTVEVVVVETIVDYLNADMHNMRHIYPYPYLVAEGVLPAGLDMRQQRQFYNCFAAKVNAAYLTMGQFFNAILADTTNTSQIRQMESQCANDLFNWVVTEVDIIETN
ncbi:MAG: hypothetical protein J6B59_04195 [Alistipes sp.]|nr:hypothetical protein [Rikenellaceae bacterium]MBO5188475.1 hypothetical protein [Alistipes sp.]MBQ2728607.1 hypothetical protein [Alistipes sp.]MBQ3082404.1 hypothetical protein [Alistipes sp.]MBQ8916924.1 hypothetical protein [Alistipes sp.]